MIRPTVRDKLLPDALRQGLLQSVLVFALSAARVGGIYAPWALAAAAVSGGKSRGLWALLGAGVGALVFFDFQTGLRFAASAVLIYSANMAFCDTKMYARKGFAPLLAALALEDTEENRARVIKAVDDCTIPIFIPTHRVGDPETEHDEEYHYPAGEDVMGAFMALEHPLD